MTRGPFYQKLPVTDRSWMLILPGRGFPLFSSWWFYFILFFLFPGWAGRAHRELLFLQEMEPLLTPSPLAKHDPARFYFLLEEFLGCPKPPPAVARMSQTGGHPGTRLSPAVPSCPHHGDSIPGTHLVPGVPFLSFWTFGVALTNSFPKGKEGGVPLVVTGH